MWAPRPEWQRVGSGASPSTQGVWRTTRSGQAVYVKRLQAPTQFDPQEWLDPAALNYWRREADVALSGAVATTPGLRAPVALSVDEDDEGISITTAAVDPDGPLPGLHLAHQLGAFAGVPVPDQHWLAHHQLRTRVGYTEYRGGWTLLARTPLADIADFLWRRRTSLLAQLDALPQVLQHGDPTPQNLVERHHDHIVTLDWATLGVGPVGADVGYLALSVRDSLDELVAAYVAALPNADADSAHQVMLAARVTLAFTALTRADWALARVAGGEGPLGAKLRHPAISSHLRLLQRNAEHLEALVGC